MGFNILKSSKNSMLNVEKINRNVYFLFKFLVNSYLMILCSISVICSFKILVK